VESIKDKVAIIGMGCTPFGELWDKSAEDLIIAAAGEAFADAGVEPKDMQAAWAGTMFDYTGLTIAKPLKLQYIPVTRVENACGTGIEAIRAAAFAVAAKVYDLVLVVTYEKMKDLGYAGLPDGAERLPRRHPVFDVGYTAAGSYALAATRYFQRYGLSSAEGKRLLAQISVKNHYNGKRNPRAHLRREVTLDEVVSAPMIAWPLGLYDCCGVTDGAAAAILCRAEDARKFRKDYITI
jgi:acetyl-CoA C-acetyltransferase